MAKYRTKMVKFVVFAMSLAALPCWAQSMSRNDQMRIIDKVVAELQDKYPFPKITAEVESTLKNNANSGAYSKISNPDAFAVRITFDLQSLTNDRHLSLSYTADSQKVEPLKIESIYASAEDLKRAEQNMRGSNYDASDVRILQGNVGYVKLQSLAPLEFAGELYASVMRFITNTDAMIFDLRDCSGASSVDAIPFFAGYLFEHPVHLTNMFIGGAAKERQLWSFGYVPGPKYLNKPVYMIISRSTFSGCEAFSYEMKALKRATLVGEVTGGGGNPNAAYPIDEHFILSVPFAHVQNPITKTNWNEVGVQPDITSARAEALYRAHIIALQNLQAEAPADRKEQYVNALEDVQAVPPRIEKVTFQLKGHAQAKSAAILGSFNSYMPWANPMEKVNGVWTTTLPMMPGRYQYLFLVDGQQVLDPANPQLNKDKRANLMIVK